MNRYRIFTNDRGIKRGVAMYSSLCGVDADSPEAAVKTVNPEFGVRGGVAPIKAINWPPTAADEAWLLKHIGFPALRGRR